MLTKRLKWCHIIYIDYYDFFPFSWSLNHKCTADTKVRGYTIPAGAVIMPNLDSVLHDEKIWGDPQNFRPERFLDNKGNLLQREEFVPFSLGMHSLAFFFRHLWHGHTSLSDIFNVLFYFPIKQIYLIISSKLNLTKWHLFLGQIFLFYVPDLA